MTTAIDMLHEYASAIRGDWGTIDGRSVQSNIWEITDAMERYHLGEMPEKEVQAMRFDLGICAQGGGHWGMYCEDYECDYECEAPK